MGACHSAPLIEQPPPSSLALPPQLRIQEVAMPAPPLPQLTLPLTPDAETRAILLRRAERLRVATQQRGLSPTASTPL